MQRTPSHRVRQFKTQEVETMEDAIAQAKTIAVPSGEDPNPFYHRKALEILRNKKQQDT